MATEDLRFYDGTSWQSLSALAAEQVVCTLPIESVDETVKVSGNASVFTVSTGGTESFKIAANQFATFQGHVGVQSPAYSTASLALQGEVKPVNAGGAYGVWVSATYVVDPAASYAKHARAFASVKAPANGQAFDTFTQFYASAVCGNDVETNYGVYVSATGAKNNVGCCVTAGGAVQAGNWGFYDNTGHASYLQGGAQTPSVRGLADNDSTITLGSQATLKAGDGSEYVPTDSASIATKKIVDDKIWVGTNAAYNAIATKNPETLYCLLTD